MELVTSLILVGVAARFGFSVTTLAFGYLACIGLVLALIDLDVHRLPDKIVIPAYPVLAVLFAIATWETGEGWWPLIRALIGGGTLFLFYFVAAVAYPGGMGFGDVKLAGVLGMALGWLGWGTLTVGAFSAFLLGGLFSGVLLIMRRARKGTGIPFGPWMILGAAVGVAVGELLWQRYLELFA